MNRTEWKKKRKSKAKKRIPKNNIISYKVMYHRITEKAKAKQRGNNRQDKWIP